MATAQLDFVDWLPTSPREVATSDATSEHVSAFFLMISSASLTLSGLSLFPHFAALSPASNHSTPFKRLPL